MKNVAFLLPIVMVIVANQSFAQERLYTIVNEKILVNESFIDPFYSEGITSATTYTLVKNYSPTWWTKYGNYAINFYKVNGWENEPEKYNYVEVLRNDTKILELKTAMGFDDILFESSNYSVVTTSDFIFKEVAEDVWMLLLTERTYASQPPMLTIAIFYKDDVKLVFNKPMFINMFNYQNELQFEMTMTANTVEYVSGNTPANAAENHRIYLSGGQLFYE